MKNKNEDWEKIRPGNGNINWDGTVKDTVKKFGKERRLIEYCEKCGKAGADIHEMKGIGNNRHPVCEGCGTKTLRHTTVDTLKDQSK